MTQTATVTTKTYHNIQRQRDTKSGIVRLYWRHAHLAKPERCIGAEGSPEFDARYEQLQAELAAWHADRATVAPAKPAKPVQFFPGSIGSVVDQFEASKKFERLKSGTQGAYRSASRLLKQHLGGFPLVQLDERNVLAYFNKIERDNGPSRRHMQQVLLSVLWKFSKSLTECRHKGKANPAREIEREYRVARPHPAWPADVQARFLDGCPTHLRHAFFLLLYTGQRRSDVVRMKKSHFNPATGVLLVEAQVKTGARVPLRIHSKLMPVLREMLAHDSEYLLINALGEPWAGYGAGLTHAFAERMRDVGIKGHRLHGLRKSAACAIAEAGATVPQMMAVFGWKSPQQAMDYIRDAGKEQLVADGMQLWEKADKRKLRLVRAG